MLPEESRVRLIDDIDKRLGIQEAVEKPLFPSVRVYNARNVSVPHDTHTAVAFTDESWDTVDDNYAIANPTRLTARRAGVYAMFGQVDFANNATGVRGLVIRVNGATIIAAVRTNTSNASWSERLCLSCRWRLEKGDYIELVAYQNSGTSLIINAMSNYSPVFEMTMVAPYY